MTSHQGHSLIEIGKASQKIKAKITEVGLNFNKSFETLQNITTRFADSKRESYRLKNELNRFFYYLFLKFLKFTFKFKINNKSKSKELKHQSTNDIKNKIEILKKQLISIHKQNDKDHETMLTKLQSNYDQHQIHFNLCQNVLFILIF